MTAVNNLFEPDYDLIIIGLGPVGCTAAILLAEAGLKIAAIEREPQVYALPRAVNLDGEVIRAFQSVGRGQAVNDLMQPVRPGDRAGFADSARRWMFGQEMKDFGSDGWQPGNMFDQPEFESYLRGEVRAHANVTSFIGYTAITLTGHDDGVSVEIEDADGSGGQQLEGKYLLGTDGAASFVRKSIGAGWQDLGYNCDWLVVDVVVKPGHTLDNSTLQVCDPDRISTYVCTKDPYRRWEFKMLPGETADDMLDEARIQSLINDWTPPDTYEVRRAAVYQFHAATATRWQQGRVFIGGDAAHQTPPFLGQGMNSGMRDVINLAWKLPLVLQGICNETLLTTYEAERNAHAHDLVEWAVSIGKLMDHLADVELARRESREEPAAPPTLKSSGYGQGRTMRPIRDGAILLNQVSERGSTGYLFAQPEVKDITGAVYRLDDILGPGFALVALQREALDLNERSYRIIDRLGINIVCLDELTLHRGHFDRLFKQSELALVRPDRIVFGHTDDTLDGDELVAELARKVDLNNPRM